MTSPVTSPGPPDDEVRYSEHRFEHKMQELFEYVLKMRADIVELLTRLPPATADTDIEHPLDNRMVLGSKADVERIKDLGNEGLVQLLQELDFLKFSLVGVRIILGKDDAGKSSVILMVRDCTADAELRINFPAVLRKLGLSSETTLLGRRYQVLIEGFSKDSTTESFDDWSAFFRLLLGIDNLRCKIIWGRFILETMSRDVAMALCRTGLTVGKTKYKLKAFAPQGTPLFCYNCHVPGHFQRDCEAETRCGRCAGPHATSECSSDTLACCNCGGDHKAWDSRCKYPSSMREFNKASYHRKNGPFWAEFLNSSASKRSADDEALDSTDQEAHKRRREDSTSDTTSMTATSSAPAATSTTSLSKTDQAAAAPKKRQGRPPKSKPANDTSQQAATASSSSSPPSSGTVESPATSKKSRGRPPKGKPFCDDRRQLSIVDYATPMDASSRTTEMPATQGLASCSSDMQVSMDMDTTGTEASVAGGDGTAVDIVPSSSQESEAQASALLPGADMMDIDSSTSQESVATGDQMSEPPTPNPGKKQNRRGKNKKAPVISGGTQEGKGSNGSSSSQEVVVAQVESPQGESSKAGSSNGNNNKKKKKNKNKNKKGKENADMNSKEA